jgi:hypothetical protein
MVGVFVSSQPAEHVHWKIDREHVRFNLEESEGVAQMNLLTPGEIAPEFETQDLRGNLVRLADFRSRQPVVLYFLRGFM